MLFVNIKDMEPFETLRGMKLALQRAIELEHATIPPYLTALYSLKPGRNLEIASLIQGIVSQEMQHMMRSANILNAIHGTPRIDFPEFVPHYPGGLPFDIGDRPGQKFDVPLKAFSLELVESVFMRIEAPVDPPDFPVGVTLDAEPPMPDFLTIGEFYQAVSKALQADWFTGDANRQVSMPGVAPVRNLADARAAIDVIVLQGEGTSKDPFDGKDGNLAHYFKFAEIFHGRELVADPTVKDLGYSYSGKPIKFEGPESVLPILTNAKSGDYPPNSVARAESDVFNQVYSNLLRALEVTFNGQPDYLNTAIGLMYDLKLQAIKLMNIKLDATTNAAPGFAYSPAV